MISDRLSALRREMNKRNISVYIVPTSDFHDSEYVGDYFKCRSFITGFTGSAGTAVITADHAGLWTDGRYFLQASMQLEGTPVTLYRMGEEGVPTISEFVANAVKPGTFVGFDGRVISSSLGHELSKLAKAKGASLHTDEDLIDLIWADRPSLPNVPVQILDICYTGKSTVEKLVDVRRKMKECGATVHVLSSLYDIAWLLNIRGGDIPYVPVVLSYLIITKNTCTWFVRSDVLSDELKQYLTDCGVSAASYVSFYEALPAITSGETVLLDGSSVNYRIRTELSADVNIIDMPNPTILMKAVKNETEIQNTRAAHLKDAVTMCRFMHWLKENIGKEEMSEISISDHLAELCAKQEHYLDLSFSTICGYAEHGAIIHYSATPESNVPVRSEGLLLVDSGRHYLEGTTDITRTFALGPVSDDMKKYFTLVLRSMLTLQNARFVYGVTGANLDVLARMPLWNLDLDYRHGTGHGVGHLLNVHEGPNNFRWKQTKNSCFEPLEEGMVTTDEPGLYLDGEYGIRLENELLCVKGNKSEYGQFMHFEPLTLVPIDLDAVDVSLLSPQERQWLNNYHEMVYQKVSPLLTVDESKWLRNATRAI